MKICKQCKIEKLLNNFYKKLSSIDGLQGKCKDCCNLNNFRYHEKNKDQIIKQQKIYRNSNKGKQQIKIHLEKCKNKINAYRKKYREENKDKIKKIKQEYIFKNKDKINKYQKNKRKNDINFNLRSIISNSINTHLNKINSSKNNNSCLNYLPYSIEELKTHIEKLFSHPDNLYEGKTWMNWNNRGLYFSKNWNDNNPSTWTWQIDHIKPHSLFNYTSMKDKSFIDCWSLNNLRPLSSKKNNYDGVNKIRHIIF
jgi:hypothetical protein